MKLKNKEVLRLNRGFSEVGKLKGAKFAYSVARNAAAIEGFVKALQKCTEPSEQYTEFDGKRVELARECADKNKDQAPATVKVNGVEEFVIGDREKFNKGIDKLRGEYGKAIEEFEKQTVDFEGILEEEIEVAIFKVKEEDLPEEITSDQLIFIKEIIDL